MKLIWQVIGMEATLVPQKWEKFSNLMTDTYLKLYSTIERLFYTLHRRFARFCRKCWSRCHTSLMRDVSCNQQRALPLLCCQIPCGQFLQRYLSFISHNRLVGISTFCHVNWDIHVTWWWTGKRNYHHSHGTDISFTCHLIQPLKLHL